MLRRNLSKVDASEFARDSLDYILEEENKKQEDIKYLTFKEALNSETVFEQETKRENTRVLFISRDDRLLNPIIQSLDGLTNISDLFDEVHILILRRGIKPRSPVLRVAKNVWLYTASHKFWWQTLKIGEDIIDEQLVFADGFRPDLIVARDPFESAILAKKLGLKYKRPTQLHIVDDYINKDFIKQNKINWFLKQTTKFNIPKFRSIRVNTKAIFDYINNRFSIEDIEILPKFNNYQTIIQAPNSFEIKNKYKQFIFTMLYIGKLNYDSGVIKVIDGGRFGLRNPHIGLIVIGDGPIYKEVEKRTEILKIKNQVIFEKKVSDIIPYLKSANLLVVSDTDEDSEELVLKGAAAGIPLLLSDSDKRKDFFVNGESAMFFNKEDINDISLKMNILMNDVSLRKEMTKQAQNMIKNKFHDNLDNYLKVYRASIEKVFLLEESIKNNK